MRADVVGVALFHADKDRAFHNTALAGLLEPLAVVHDEVHDLVHILIHGERQLPVRAGGKAAEVDEAHHLGVIDDLQVVVKLHRRGTQANVGDDASEVTEDNAVAEAHLILHDEEQAADQVADDALRAIADDQGDHAGGGEDHRGVHANLVECVDAHHHDYDELHDARDQVADGLCAGIHSAGEHPEQLFQQRDADHGVHDGQQNGGQGENAHLVIPLVGEQVVGNRFLREKCIADVHADQHREHQSKQPPGHLLERLVQLFVLFLHGAALLGEHAGQNAAVVILQPVVDLPIHAGHEQDRQRENEAARNDARQNARHRLCQRLVALRADDDVLIIVHGVDVIIIAADPLRTAVARQQRDIRQSVGDGAHLGGGRRRPQHRVRLRRGNKYLRVSVGVHAQQRRVDVGLLPHGAQGAVRQRHADEARRVETAHRGIEAGAVRLLAHQADVGVVEQRPQGELIVLRVLAERITDVAVRRHHRRSRFVIDHGADEIHVAGQLGEVACVKVLAHHFLHFSDHRRAVDHQIAEDVADLYPLLVAELHLIDEAVEVILHLGIMIGVVGQKRQMYRNHPGQHQTNQQQHCRMPRYGEIDVIILGELLALLLILNARALLPHTHGAEPNKHEDQQHQAVLRRDGAQCAGRDGAQRRIGKDGVAVIHLDLHEVDAAGQGAFPAIEARLNALLLISGALGIIGNHALVQEVVVFRAGVGKHLARGVFDDAQLAGGGLQNPLEVHIVDFLRVLPLEAKPSAVQANRGIVIVLRFRHAGGLERAQLLIIQLERTRVVGGNLAARVRIVEYLAVAHAVGIVAEACLRHAGVVKIDLGDVCKDLRLPQVETLIGRLERILKADEVPYRKHGVRHGFIGRVQLAPVLLRRGSRHAPHHAEQQHGGKRQDKDDSVLFLLFELVLRGFRSRGCVLFFHFCFSLCMFSQCDQFSPMTISLSSGVSVTLSLRDRSNLHLKSAAVMVPIIT